MTIRRRIDGLDWDTGNREHIAKHDVEPDEVEQVVRSDNVYKESCKGRYLLIGRTHSGRVLSVAIGEAPAQPGACYVFSARPASRKVPAFNSIEEEAEFWDTHDFTDFSELTPADFDDTPESGYSISVKLAPTDRDELDRQAEAMGVEPSTLVRMWVEERLRREAS